MAGQRELSLKAFIPLSSEKWFEGDYVVKSQRWRKIFHPKLSDMHISKLYRCLRFSYLTDFYLDSKLFSQ